MHILTDSDSAPVFREHSQDNRTAQQCEASDGHCTSDGNCSSCQAHAHTYAQGGSRLPDPQTPQQMAALLEQMLRHNQQQASVLDQFSSKLMDMDREASAMQLQKAADDFSKGNLYLSLALSLLKEE